MEYNIEAEATVLAEFESWRSMDSSTTNDGSLISDYDKAHIESILNGEGDWFTAQLLRLVAKADTANRGRLHEAFPEVVDAYLEWYYHVEVPATGAGGKMGHSTGAI